MSIIQQNFLSPVEFKLIINKLPEVAFFVQQANVPGLSASFITQATPFNPIYRHGNSGEFDTFDVTVRVDENMDCFTSIFDWIIKGTYSYNLSGYKELSDTIDGLYSDATLMIFNNSKNPGILVKFTDIFPVSLGAIQMDTTSTDVTYATTTISFKINTMTIEKL